MSETRTMPVLIRLRLGLGLAVIVVFAYAAWASVDLTGIARPFPLSASVVGLVLAIASVVVDVVRWRRGQSVPGDAMESTAVIRASSDDGADDSGGAALRALFYLGIVIGYLAAIWLVGVYAASAVLLLYFGRREARSSWLMTVLASAVVVGGLAAVVGLLGLELPSSLVGW